MKCDLKSIKRKHSAGCAAVVLAGALALSSCAILPREEEFRQAPTVSEYSAAAFVTAACMKTDVEVTASVNLNYVPIQEANLAFGVSGLAYDEFFVSAGDIVAAGDVLAQLDMGDLESKIDETGDVIASYELQLRQSEENRAIAVQKTYVQSQNLSEEDRNAAVRKTNESYDSVKQSLEDKIVIAKLRLEDYEKQKAARQLVAPFDGTVTYIYPYSAADRSDITKVIVTVADSSMSLFRGKTDVWEAFTSGTEAVVVTSSGDYEAVVRTEEELGITPTEHVAGEKGLVYFVLKEVAYDIKDNTNGKATIVREAHRGVLSVPLKAVSAINGNPVVYVPDENGLKNYREVELGLIGDSRVEIVSGLEEGERVVIN